MPRSKRHSLLEGRYLWKKLRVKEGGGCLLKGAYFGSLQYNFFYTGTWCKFGVFLLLTTVGADEAPHNEWKRQQPDEINTSE